ncbi:sugar transporter [Helicobacter magdeburgensis]|uniref:Sugar transporter n=1 Tax=Helicobacter magdeburgensis TaxID=471858 RepID=A0A4U8SZV5_9HELI|nr:sugar transporter [Helicobacter magdeburgensis]TLD92624.1 sugar transporter [Helicobacter magdeburgensis]
MQDKCHKGFKSFNQDSSIFAWLPVLCVTFGAFIFNTSEFIPIGLLGAIGNDFSMSDSEVGVMLTIYAWVVALASLPLMLYFAQSNLKSLMLGVIAVFVLSHSISALSQNFIMLVASRIGVALSHALFWSIASVMAVRAAPKGKQSSALGFVITGSSLAMIAGLPLGRMIGLYVDWRVSFLCIGLVALCVGIAFWRVFPTMPNTQNISLKTLPTLLQNKAFMKICFLTLVFVSGHFSAYTYIEPFLENVAGFRANSVTFILCLFGLMGVVGSVLFARFYERFHLAFVRLSLFGLGFSMLLLYVVSESSLATTLLCAVWGLCFMLFGVIFQSQVIAAVPNATAVAMSIFSGIFNVGIGSGALIGGLAYTHFGIESIGFVASGICAFAALYFVSAMGFAKVFRKFRQV